MDQAWKYSSRVTNQLYWQTRINILRGARIYCSNNGLFFSCMSENLLVSYARKDSKMRLSSLCFRQSGRRNQNQILIIRVINRKIMKSLMWSTGSLERKILAMYYLHDRLFLGLQYFSLQNLNMLQISFDIPKEQKRIVCNYGCVVRIYFFTSYSRHCTKNEEILHGKLYFLCSETLILGDSTLPSFYFFGC